MFQEEVDALVENYLGGLLRGHAARQIAIEHVLRYTHSQFPDEYLRRQRIALASWDHQEAAAVYREKREGDFST